MIDRPVVGGLGRSCFGFLGESMTMMTLPMRALAFTPALVCFLSSQASAWNADSQETHPALTDIPVGCIVVG